MVLGDLVEFPAYGIGNMSVPIRPGYRFVVSYIRCHFRRISGSGTEVASFTVDLDSRRGDDFDVRLLTVASAGVSADINIRVTDESREQWTFEDRDGLTCNWTNPETGGEIAWGLVVGIRPWQ